MYDSWSYVYNNKHTDLWQFFRNLNYDPDVCTSLVYIWDINERVYENNNSIKKLTAVSEENKELTKINVTVNGSILDKIVELLETNKEILESLKSIEKMLSNNE